VRRGGREEGEEGMLFTKMNVFEMAKEAKGKKEEAE
jgi:hypothetical protein